jgi:hypothetical protein
MSARNKHRMCVYCRKVKKTTDDHVPPKLLLEKPFPSNLVTVPACRDCNQSFMKDDEYTRLLALDVRAANNAAAQSNLSAILRSLQRPNAKGFAEYLANQGTDSTILGVGGSPMGRVTEVNKRRVNATGSRIVRGLYFVELGRPMPEGAVLKVGCKDGLTPADPDIQTLARIMQQMPDRRYRAFGTAFSYVAGVGGGVSFWLMLLYDYFIWLVTVDERNTSERGTFAPAQDREGGLQTS